MTTPDDGRSAWAGLAGFVAAAGCIGIGVIVFILSLLF
jgi:hypothetical protein